MLQQFIMTSIGRTAADAYRLAKTQAAIERTNPVSSTRGFVVVESPIRNELKWARYVLAGIAINNASAAYREAVDASCVRDDLDGAWQQRLEADKAIPKRLRGTAASQASIIQPGGECVMIEAHGKVARDQKKENGFGGKHGRVFLIVGIG